MSDLDELKSLLRESGLRATSQRIAVLRCLGATAKPLSHAEVCELLADYGFDRATVYRNLTDLTEAGLVRRTDLGDHVWRFELITTSDHHGASHPHFICNECGTVACVPEMSVSIVKNRGVPKALRSQDFEVQVRGVCDDCR